MVIDIVLLQDSAPVVVEINAHLLAAVDAVTPEYRLATCGDPDPSQGIRVDLVAFNDTTPIIMLK